MRFNVVSCIFPQLIPKFCYAHIHIIKYLCHLYKMYYVFTQYKNKTVRDVYFFSFLYYLVIL